MSHDISVRHVENLHFFSCICIRNYCCGVFYSTRHKMVAHLMKSREILMPRPQKLFAGLIIADLTEALWLV